MNPLKHGKNLCQQWWGATIATRKVAIDRNLKHLWSLYVIWNLFLCVKTMKMSQSWKTDLTGSRSAKSKLAMGKSKDVPKHSTAISQDQDLAGIVGQQLWNTEFLPYESTWRARVSWFWSTTISLSSYSLALSITFPCDLYFFLCFVSLG